MLGAVEQRAYFYGEISRRNGTRLLGFPPQQPYPSTIRPCRDGYVHAHSNNRHRDLLGALIPHERLLDPHLLEYMMGHADEIDAIMDEWLADRDRRDVVQEAQALRLPFTEVMKPGEVLDDPHHRERGSFIELDHPGAPRVRQPAAPVRMHGTPFEVRRAPLLGEHSGEVAAEIGQATPRTPASGGTESERRRPLEGYRVLDFTNAVAGPIASFILADLGADVIKVEGPTGRPRKAPGTAPLAEGGDDLPWNRIMNYNELNHGKRGVSLDVATPEGRDLFLRLAKHADVVVQNFSPRVMDNLGINYARLSEVNPGIVLVSMPAFGLDGPYRDRIAYGPGIDAMSGLAHLTGYADGPPMKPGNFFCDQQSGVLAALSAQAALWHREQTGEGQHVELAMIEGEFQVLADAYIDYEWNGRERMRCGNDHSAYAPHDTYRCQGEDAWVAIAVQTDEQWQALCGVMGDTELAADPRFADAAERYANRSALRPNIEAWTSQRTHYEVQDALQAAGVPAGAALNCLEILSDPHVVARSGFDYVDVPNVGSTPYPRVAFQLSETPVPIRKAAPGYGEDNEDVFRGIAGLSDAELRALEEQGITPRIPAEH
ncbi:MAG: CoA transferase [Dehalococcoidia bacterium]|nr:CoA transferase [Dehalococcoidia bacterium]